MSWQTYTLDASKYRGITGRDVPGADVIAAGRSLVQDVCRGRVAEHFSAQDGEAAFWDTVASISEMTPALDALLVYATAYHDFGGLFASGGNADHVRQQQYFDPNGEPAPTGLLPGAAKGFAVAVGGAIVRDDASVSIASPVQASADDETFTSAKMDDFTAMY